MCSTDTEVQTLAGEICATQSPMQEATQTGINQRPWINVLFPIGKPLWHNTINSIPGFIVPITKPRSLLQQ